MRRLLIAGGMIVATMTACLGSTEALPLAVSIQAPTSGTTTDSVTIVVTAQGNSLVGVTATFGDGSDANYSTGGARTATVSFRHRYTLSGTYQVTATVTDAVLGNKDATAQVSIQ